MNKGNKNQIEVELLENVTSKVNQEIIDNLLLVKEGKVVNNEIVKVIGIKIFKRNLEVINEVVIL